MKGTRILLDPRRPEGLSFTSHAHSDHAPRGSVGERLIASKETRGLLGFPGEGKREFEFNGLRFRVLNAGHILGSSQLCVEDGFTLVYTGDMNLAGGLTTGKAEVPKKCDVLILEATFGSPRYVFPPRVEVLKEIRDWADGCFAKGTRPVLLAYALGKAQELTKGLSMNLGIRVDPSVLRFNQRYESLGVDLGRYGPYEEGEDGDYVVIAPPGTRGRWEGHPRAFVSGWALDGNAARRYGVEEAFPVSAPSDFPSLLEYVEKAQPQVVYTVHGSAGELSEELRARGFYSEPLSGLRYL